MSFRPLLARAGQAAAAAGGVALNQPAQARSAPIPQQHQHIADVKNPCEDEWTLAQFDKGDVVFLRPEDINQAVDDFRNATYGMRSGEDHDETSSNDSDERRATEVIELSESMHHASSMANTTFVNGEGVNVLLDLATEMLKRPSIQQEVMSIIADNPHLHRALVAAPPASPALIAGPQPRLLLDAPPPPYVEELEDDASERASEAGHQQAGEDAWHALLANLQQTLSAMGSQLGGLRMRLAHWLRVLLLGQRGDQVHNDKPAAAAAAEGFLPSGATGGIPGGEGMHPFLRAAMAVAVVLACVAVARRPGLAAGIAALAARRASTRN